MQFTRFQSSLIAAFLPFIFAAGIHAISSVNPQPGQSDWTVTSNIGVVLDEVTPYQPTEISDSDAVGSTVTISSPGIYRLSAPMTKLIVISASNVELDLNEYGVTVSGAVIAITVGPGVSNVIVRNGYVTGTGGATTGIYVDGFTGVTSKVFIKSVRVSGFTNGIYMHGNPLEVCEVTSCTANNNTTYGFLLIDCDYSIFSHCTASGNATGFSIQINDTIFNNCTATANTTGFRLNGADRSLLENCVATNNTTGFATISSGTNNMIQSCVAIANTTGYSTLGSNFAYQNKDITGSAFAWVDNVAATP